MTVQIVVDGNPLHVREGVTLLAALYDCNVVALRKSVSGEARSGLCGMGTCFECRVCVDGVPHTRACMTIVCDGMVVTTRD